jgi:hypothetical protein
MGNTVVTECAIPEDAWVYHEGETRIEFGGKKECSVRSTVAPSRVSSAPGPAFEPSDTVRILVPDGVGNSF